LSTTLARPKTWAVTLFSMTTASTSAMRWRSQVPAHDFGRLLVALAQFFDVGLQLLGLGLQVVGAHQFGHHQTQAHAALGLGPEQFGPGSGPCRRP
jgi:hypothetical protein